ncbi:MAG: hypothetical protein JWN86_1994 [Planctomycetota bacterium]|nr:hypothetical protein [Planctomycetota bacterium]
MTYDVQKTDDRDTREATLPRVFLREPGWHISQRVGSEKTFCYQMAPGEEFYHRLLDGEVIVSRGEEKLCLPCAERRGLLTFLPKPLRDQLAGVDIEVTERLGEYEVKG